MTYHLAKQKKAEVLVDPDFLNPNFSTLALAYRYGVHYQTIYRWRIEAGVPRRKYVTSRVANPTPRPKGNPYPQVTNGNSISDQLRKDPRLGVVADNALAKEYGVSRELIRRVRKGLTMPRAILEESLGAKIRRDPQLGKITDIEMAAKHGVSHPYACQIRGEAGLASVSPPPIPKDSISAKIRLDPRLGKTTDRVIAESYGVQQSTVNVVRNKLGIPNFRGQKPRVNKDGLGIPPCNRNHTEPKEAQ